MSPIDTKALHDGAANGPKPRPPAEASRLELRLAGVLRHGTWLASAVIALGLALAMLGWRPGAHEPALLSSMHLVAAGVAGFILLPVLRVVLMLIDFVRARDHRLVAITALVLTIILAAFALGMYLPPAV